jgi:SPW repeat-containing protein
MYYGHNKSLNPVGKETANASWINVLLGIWVIVSPYVLQVAHYPRALWNNVVCGVVITLLASIRALAPEQRGWSWTNMCIGGWIIISPSLLGFTNTIAFWNNLILGVIIATAAWANATTKSELTI